MEAKEEVIDWLLEGDPSLKFQTLRDLKDESENLLEIQQEISKKGWGKKLLARQEEDGGFPRSIYSKWDGTHYTMMLLRRLCLSQDDEDAERACSLLLKKGSLKYVIIL